MSKTNHRWVVIIATVITAAFTYHCQAAGRIDACKLISSTQASSILGTRITAKAIHSAAAGPDAGSMCNYSNGSAHGGFMLIVGHVRYSNAWKEVARQEKVSLSSTPRFLPKPHFSRVTGLGDAAYLSKTSSYFQLHVLSHGNAIVINRNMKADSGAVGQAKKLARLALRNL